MFLQQMISSDECVNDVGYDDREDNLNHGVRVKWTSHILPLSVEVHTQQQQQQP